jgi:phospholipase/lecithinase/hemolysin
MSVHICIALQANIIHITKQLRYFQQYQNRLSALIGAEATTRLVRGALVLITLGGNDFVNNYYLVPYSARSRELSLPDYVSYLLSEYAQILEHLYDLGARRVLVQGVGPIGCVPAELALHSLDGTCDPELQRAAEMYNPRLMELLQDLNARHGAQVFVGVNMKRIHDDFIEDPKAYGFATATEACCGQGRFNGMGLCTVVSSLCADRDSYVFWDAFHPTERANRLIVQQFMSGSVDYIAHRPRHRPPEAAAAHVMNLIRLQLQLQLQLHRHCCMHAIRVLVCSLDLEYTHPGY